MAHFLQPLGLDQKTEAVWRALLALGDAPASVVAERAGLKRTSAYHVLENLIAMGLATSYKERGGTRFVAEHPSKLKAFFERRAIVAERIIPDLEKEARKISFTRAVRIFEGKEAIKALTEEALSAKEKKVLTLGSSKKLLELLGGKYGFGKRRRERRIFSRDLRFREDAAKGLPASFHDVRILPDTFRFPGYMLIFDKSVGIITFEEPLRGILVTDPAYATMMRSVFEALWEEVGEKP